MKKKIFAVLCMVVLLVSVFSISAFADYAGDDIAFFNATNENGVYKWFYYRYDGSVGYYDWYTTMTFQNQEYLYTLGIVVSSDVWSLFSTEFYGEETFYYSLTVNGDTRSYYITIDTVGNTINWTSPATHGSDFELDVSQDTDVVLIPIQTFPVNQGGDLSLADFLFKETSDKRSAVFLFNNQQYQAALLNNNTYSAQMTSQYNSGFDAGVDQGFEDGYEIGYQRGMSGPSYQLGYNAGYNQGFEDGGGSPIESSGKRLISTVVTAPVNMFRQIFNFEILGINIANFVFGILSLLLVVVIVKFVLKTVV